MRLIDADPLKRDISSEWLSTDTKQAFYKIIDNAPTVTIKEWVAEMPLYIKDAMLETLAKDTSKIVNDTADNFCPNCGADMRENDNNG